MTRMNMCLWIAGNTDTDTDTDCMLGKWPEKSIFLHVFKFRPFFLQPVGLETCENYSAHENAFLWTYSAPYLVIFGGKALGYAKMFPNVCLSFPGI